MRSTGPVSIARGPRRTQLGLGTTVRVANRELGLELGDQARDARPEGRPIRRPDAEHFGHVVPRLFAVPNPPVGSSAAVPAYELDELLATKLRARYQRRKGRDLFDLCWAHEMAEPDPTRVVALLREYQAAAGRPMIRASELRANLAAKRTPEFLEEVRPLLRPGIAYDATTTLD